MSAPFRTVTVASLADYIKEVEALLDRIPARRMVFRGQSNAAHPVVAGVSRRWERGYLRYPLPGEVFQDQQQLIDGARQRADSHTIVANMTDLQLLAEIQHYGGATMLIDFTYDAVTALYFAVNSEVNDGKVFCLDIRKSDEFVELGFDDAKRTVKELYSISVERRAEGGSPMAWWWVPPFRNNRIIKQDSVFIINDTGVLQDGQFALVITINADAKTAIRAALKKAFARDEETMFPDFFGYVDNNRWTVSRRLPTAFDYLNKADSQARKGNFVQAIDFYHKALSARPNMPEALYNMGVTYFRMGQFEQAVSSYQKAVELDPGSESAWFNLGYTLGRLYRFDEAIEAYKRVLELLDEDDDRAVYNLGLMYRGKNELARALELFDEAIRIRPDKQEAWYAKGATLVGLKRFDEALKATTKALQLNPLHANSWLVQGNALSSMGQYEKAGEAFARAFELNPDDPSGVLNLGWNELLLGRVAEARNRFALAFSGGNRTYAALNLGNADLLEGKTDLAIENYLLAANHWETKESFWEIFTKDLKTLAKLGLSHKTIEEVESVVRNRTTAKRNDESGDMSG